MILKADPGKLRAISWKAYGVRFGFGGAVTVLTGVIGAAFGPVVGGLFLAFPSISSASLTLLQKHAGKSAVGVDACGSALGCIGLLGFAAVAWAGASRWPGWLTLVAAMIAWALLCLGSWLSFRWVRHHAHRKRLPIRMV